MTEHKAREFKIAPPRSLLNSISQSLKPNSVKPKLRVNICDKNDIIKTLFMKKLGQEPSEDDIKHIWSIPEPIATATIYYLKTFKIPFSINYLYLKILKRPIDLDSLGG